MTTHDPTVMPYIGGPTGKWVVTCRCGLSVTYELEDDARARAEAHRAEITPR